MLKPREIRLLIRDAATDFKKNNGPKLSASLAFYTLFSLAPMLLIIIFISKVFLGRKTVESGIYTKIDGIIGQQATLQIQSLIKNASLNSTDFMAVFGLIVLVIAATTSFMEVQSSLNVIWNLKLKSGRFWKELLTGRLLSFCMVAGLGVLLLVSLLLNGFLEVFMDRFREVFPNVAVMTIYLVNQAVTFLFVALLFSVIYKVLPYASIKWAEASAGAIFGSVLFMLGKFLLGFVISKSGLNGTYGAVASLVILLVWIFYSAITLYFGAEIAKIYALKHGETLKPKNHAFVVEWVTVGQPTLKKDQDVE